MSYDHVALSVLVLMLCALATKAQEPPRNCVSTGSTTCVESCVGLANGLYQWCGACRSFIQCSGNVRTFQQCSGELLYSDYTKNCQPVSETCHECTVDIAQNDVNATTLTPPIGALCQSTGPNCRSKCYSTPDGNYQWCSRCDYFLQCSGGYEYYQKCPAGLYYDHSTQTCETSSTTCFQSPCYENLTTTVFTTIGSTTIGSTTIGSTTIGSTTLYDPCSSSPCMNGGTCINGGGSAYSCQCPPSFNGLQCQTANPCYSSPCLNGGTCTNNGQLYSCDCPPSYTGPECQTANPCHSFPCLNGGSCTTNGEDSYSCNCPSTFTGPKCQTELNDVNATSSCGDLMKSTPYDPSPGWTTLCQITTNDTALVNTPCGDLLQGLPIYGDSVGLLEAGGNFGCWLTKQYPDDIQRGCRNGYQQTHMLASCLSCTHLIVCLLYP